MAVPRRGRLIKNASIVQIVTLQQVSVQGGVRVEKGKTSFFTEYV